MRKAQTLLFLAALLFPFLSYAQHDISVEYSALKVNPIHNIPWYGELSVSELNETEFIALYTKTYLDNQNITFVQTKSQDDKIGFTHTRYQQYCNGVEVHNGSLILHSKNGVVESFNGEIYTVEPEAISATSSSMSIHYASQIANLFVESLSNDYADAIIYKTPDIVIAENSNSKQMELACRLLIKSEEHAFLNKYLVNVKSLENIRVEPQYVHSDSVGSANTYYRGVRTITTDFISASAGFRLLETGRPIATYKSTLGNYFTDTDNYWNNGSDRIGADVHWGGEVVHDWLDEYLDWDSYDGNGDTIKAVLNMGSSGNAYWNLADNYSTYLAGSSSIADRTAAIDVVGHEIGHGIADENAGLVYTGQSCMLHESYADISGTISERYGDSANWNWIIGDQIWTGGIRDMEDPSTFGHPMYYTSSIGGGCHGGGGVQNYWYYLMDHGDTGTNVASANYSLPGLGRDAALQIHFRSLLFYVTANTGYEDVATYTIKSAKDLYGSCSNELSHTWDAWQAVGIEDTTVDIIDMTHDLLGPTMSCNGPGTTISFSSKGDVSRECIWTIEGSSDTAWNTSHTFNDAGITPVYLSTEVCDSVMYDTSLVNVYYTPTPTFSDTGLVVCQSIDSMKFTNTTVNLDTNKALTYKWEVQPFYYEATTTDLVVPINDPRETTIYLFASYNGKCEESFTKDFAILEGLEASFTVEDFCDNETITVDNTTPASIYDVSIFWRLNDSLISESTQPNITTAQIGSNTLQLEVRIDSFGCSEIVNEGFEVFEAKDADFSVTSACLGSDIQLINTTVDSVGWWTLNWNLGIYSPANQDTVYFEAMDTSILTITLTYTDSNTCVSSRTKDIQVEDIEAVTTFPTSICQGDSFSLQNNSRGDGISHSWDFDDGNNEGGSEVMHAYENAGTYEISYKVDNANCSSETSGTVSVLESPVAQFDVEGTCVGDTVVFTSRSSVADTNTTYTWSFADGTTSSQPDSVKHAYSSPAIYNTSLDLQNSNGCSDYLVKPVLVSSNPTCGFAVNEGSSATLFELEAEESNYTNYTWLVDSAVIGTGSNLTYDFGQSGTYTVTLNIETQYGCTCSYEENFSIAKTASLKPVIDGISLYPNPSAGVFSIVGKRVNQIRAYNNLGQEVKVLEQTSGVYKLDNSLQNGAYVISVDTEMGTSNHRLILVK